MMNYHAKACEHEDTERRCKDQGTVYLPVVFTAQGDIGRHAEFALSRISDAIAQQEGASPDVIKAELVAQISLELAQQVGRAIVRRRCRTGRQLAGTAGDEDT